MPELAHKKTVDMDGLRCLTRNRCLNGLNVGGFLNCIKKVEDALNGRTLPR